MLSELSIEELKGVARRLRVEIIKMLGVAGSGHPGGSLSLAELLTVLYFRVLDHHPDDPLWPGRDRVILSKGHACPALYAVLTLCGYFPAEILGTLRKLGSPLQGHPSSDTRLPGIEVSTGSLGQGLSISCGIALAARMDNASYRVYCILGDGELQEGQIWEAAMTAGHYKLDNICAIVDNNNLQIDGSIPEVMNVYPLPEKFRSFGWEVLEIDGHDITSIIYAFEKAASFRGKPVVIIAHTIKGKGVSFMENQAEWHGIAPDQKQTERALKELKEGEVES
ncbi:transketolase [bacterium]|nr:transketolase [bacterium]